MRSVDWAVPLLLAGYFGLLLGLTMPPLFTGNHPSLEHRLQLRPLRTTTRFLAMGGWPMLVNVVGNLAAFVPLGFLIPLLRRPRLTGWQVVLLAAAASLLIETLQYVLGRRTADVDDVLLNTLGGWLGYLLLLGVCRFGLRPVPRSPHPDLGPVRADGGA